MRPADLRCEHRRDVPCLDEPAPRLSWALESSQREKRQSAYRIRVWAGDAVLCDSGRVESSNSVDVVYVGPALPPATECRWDVQVWDELGEASEPSEPARFRTGLRDWRARWIFREAAEDPGVPVPGNQPERAADIEAHDWHLTTGFVGVGLLCPVLTEAGYADVAYRLLLNETFPSWGYSIRHGATTIWERWDGWTAEHGFQTPMMNSFNHYSLGSVAQWLYEYVAGIRIDPERPGYEHVVIAPVPGELEHAAATLRTVRGPIRSAWRRSDDEFELTVELPANVTGTVILPDGSVTEIGSGTHDFAVTAARGGLSR